MSDVAQDDSSDHSETIKNKEEKDDIIEAKSHLRHRRASDNHSPFLFSDLTLSHIPGRTPSHKDNNSKSHFKGVKSPRTCKNSKKSVITHENPFDVDEGHDSRGSFQEGDSKASRPKRGSKKSHFKGK